MRRPLISVLLALLAQAAAAAYPERPITMIVAYPPGGGTDLIARAHPGAVTVGTTGIARTTISRCSSSSAPRA
jgi:tripartite-type tricarboxylate transporter receptor subunit TctC